MPAFLVCYDLPHAGTDADYQRLWARLREWQAKQVLFSVWLIAGDTSPLAIYEDLVDYISATDRLLVMGVTGEAVWGNKRLLTPDHEAKEMLGR
jgi:hypothetical protein